MGDSSVINSLVAPIFERVTLTLIVPLFILIGPQTLVSSSLDFLGIDNPLRNIIVTFFALCEFSIVPCRVGQPFVISFSPLGSSSSALVIGVIDQSKLLGPFRRTVSTVTIHKQKRMLGSVSKDKGCCETACDLLVSNVLNVKVVSVTGNICTFGQDVHQYLGP